MIKVYFSDKMDGQFRKAHPDDAGYDLKATHDAVIQPGEVALIGTGLYISIPAGVVALVKSRSGLALKKNVGCDGGVIDAGYRGEVGVILRNYGREPFKVERGDRVAQMLLVRLVEDLLPIEEVGSVEELGESTRSDAGYGSTGYKANG